MQWVEHGNPYLHHTKKGTPPVTRIDALIELLDVAH